MKVNFIKTKLKDLVKWFGIMEISMKGNGKKDKWMVMVNFKKQTSKYIKGILNKIKDMDMVNIYLIVK